MEKNEGNDSVVRSGFTHFWQLGKCKCRRKPYSQRVAQRSKQKREFFQSLSGA